MIKPFYKVVLTFSAFAVLAACSSTYYSALEKVGIEKRDILTSRVENALDAQEDAKEQFASALEQYRSVVKFDGGDIEKAYDRLNSVYERSRDRAEKVTDRIDSIENVASDLFKEWDAEIREYSDPKLRSRSQALRRETETEYKQMLRAMRRAESSMNPVLALFNDQVLFLRHNLNARAIGALDDELLTIEGATEALIREMEQSIAEAGRFIDSMS